MSHWHQRFLVRHQYEPENISQEQWNHLEEEWALRTKYIPNDTFLLEVPFYDFNRPMRMAGAGKFLGNKGMTVSEFF